MQQRRAAFPFNDVHSFKDYVIFVQICLPDRFRPREGAGPEDQWTLDLAFEGLRHGLRLAEAENVGKEIVDECQIEVDTALKSYQAGDVRGGFFALERLSRILKRVRTQ